MQLGIIPFDGLEVGNGDGSFGEADDTTDDRGAFDPGMLLLGLDRRGAL